MSAIAFRWTDEIPTPIKKSLKPNERCLLLALCAKSNVNGIIWHSVEWLAAWVGMARSAGKQAMAGLVDKGLVTRIDRPGRSRKGGQKTSVTILPLPVSLAPHECDDGHLPPDFDISDYNAGLELARARMESEGLQGDTRGRISYPANQGGRGRISYPATDTRGRNSYPAWQKPGYEIHTHNKKGKDNTGIIKTGGGEEKGKPLDSAEIPSGISAPPPVITEDKKRLADLSQLHTPKNVNLTAQRLIERDGAFENSNNLGKVVRVVAAFNGACESIGLVGDNAVARQGKLTEKAKLVAALLKAGFQDQDFLTVFYGLAAEAQHGNNPKNFEYFTLTTICRTPARFEATLDRFKTKAAAPITKTTTPPSRVYS